MTNEEKYKTPEERNKAFTKFCDTHSCADGCPCYKGGVACRFVWLALEAEEELLACPFCGYPAPYLHENGERWLVSCGACGVEVFRSTRDSAIIAWNRRADGNMEAEIPR